VATLSMPGDATTLPLRDEPAGGAFGGLRRRLLRRRSGALATPDARVRAGAVALLVIVLLSLLIVIMAADRPSLLSATTHANFLPRWMAGPLGGLWPGLTRNGTTLKYLFSGAIVAMYAAYLLCFAWAPRLPVRWVIAAILAVHAIFLLSPPLALTDIFNYVNYGRMEVVHHLNPYTTIPILEPHTDPSYALSNWHQLLSPYGPLFTLMTFALVPLGVAASFWAIKAVLALASLATLVLVWRCARLLGRDPVAAIVLVGLNPVVLVWGLGGDHNDFLMVFLITLGFYLLLLARERAREQERAGSPGPRGRGTLALPEIGAGAAFVTATAIKASAGVLLPVVLAGLLRNRRALLNVVVGALAAAAVVAIASLLAFGLHIPDLNTQSRLVTNESVPNLIGLAVGAGGESEAIRGIMSAVLAASVLACCWLAWRRRDAITASGWASVALLVTLSWVLPWYVLWVLPLAALSSSRRLRTAALVLGVYLIVAWAPASGLLWDAIGFQPEKTSLGRLHHRYVRELLN
jgi:alpha-1,6-mannosyltransferase